MFFLIKWFAPYIPALKCRALRRFFGNSVVAVVLCRSPKLGQNLFIFVGFLVQSTRYGNHCPSHNAPNF
jgi:hypothetical protein